MPTPILVEEIFQKLVEELESVESIRQRSYLIREFTAMLEGKYEKYESYLAELIQLWPVYSGPITYSGISPVELKDNLRLLWEIASVSDAIREQKRFKKIVSRLNEVAIIADICIGNAKSVFDLFYSRGAGNRLGLPASEGRLEPQARIGQDLNHLRAILENVPPGQINIKGGIKKERVLSDIDYILKARNENECLIPVIECFETLSGNKKCYGRLRRLTVTVNKEIKNPQDQILRRYNIVGIEKSLLNEYHDVSKVARLLLDEFNMTVGDKKYSGEISYEFIGAKHLGTSSKAATATLWFTGLQEKAGLRERYCLKKNIVITGDIDENGAILPVSTESIQAKAEAVFYSWTSLLIVPSAQEKHFRTKLGKLEAENSEKKITLFAPAHLRELFYDRRISNHINPSKIQYFAKKAWQKKFEAGGIITILLLSLITFRLAYGPLDKNPVLGEFSGEVLKVKNQMGAVLETIHVGERTVSRAENISRSNLAEFADLTGNGMNDIIWAEINPEPRIAAKELKGKNNLWQDTMDYDLIFPQKPFVLGSNYNPLKIRAGDFTNNGELEILVSANHTTYFPSILALRNAKTGMEIAHFVNPGRIMDFDVGDITGDGQMEIVIGGVNNAYNSAFVAILSMDHLSGMAPTTKEYELEGYDLLENISYVLLPKTIVGASIAQHTLYSVAERIQIINDGDVIQVYVRDFTQYRGVERQLPASVAHVQFFFNSDLSVRGIGTSDGYDLTADYLYREGIIGRLPDYLYFEEFKKELLYWNGEEFVENSSK